MCVNKNNAKYELNQLYIKYLERETMVNQIKNFFTEFDQNKRDVSFKKGIYIYGPSGSGKTELILHILKEMNYNVVKYDTGDVRNKTLIDTITKNNMSDKSVVSMMNGGVKKLAILMDEIDGMNNGDKGGINSLIKLIRPKKTKKQKTEDVTMNPIVCIGNYHSDKKIRELMKVCVTFECKRPTDEQIQRLLLHIANTKFISSISSSSVTSHIPYLIQMVPFIHGDLRKMNMYYEMYNHNPAIFEKSCSSLLQNTAFIDNVKSITGQLFTRHVSIDQHNIFMNDTDRTIVALLWHENVADVIYKQPLWEKLKWYSSVLKNICFSDYMDRITFQNQIWQFNEMTSLLKTFYNNKMCHDTFPGIHAPPEIRFTKVLTKYSTEYNNTTFIYTLCQKLHLDQKDLNLFFNILRDIHGDAICNDGDVLANVTKTLEVYGMSKIYIKRMYRFLDVAARKDASIDEEYMETFDMNDTDDDTPYANMTGSE